MNERIKELAEQAGYNIKELDTQEQLVAEKFAELLIKECTKVLEIKGAETGQEPYYYGASLIEEHFGVEE
jgi:hypothetical protein